MSLWIILDLYDKKRGPSNDDKLEVQINMFKKLLDMGVITEEEFVVKKKQLLGL